MTRFQLMMPLSAQDVQKNLTGTECTRPGLHFFSVLVGMNYLRCLAPFLSLYDHFEIRRSLSRKWHHDHDHIDETLSYQ